LRILKKHHSIFLELLAMDLARILSPKPMRNIWKMNVHKHNRRICMKTILGIDIGGSGVKGALVDIESGEMLTERMRLETPKNGKPDDIASLVKQIIQHFSWTGLVGVGFPAVIRNGVAITAANISEKWIGKNVDELLSKDTSCKVFTINDADAAGLAEMAFGAGKNEVSGVVMMITLGTGIGSALFTDRHLLPNTELGHLIIKGKDAEKLASDAARKRKELTWKQWAKRVQIYLDLIEYLFYIDLIIIGGGVSREHEKFFPHIKTRARIVPAELLNQAGIVGAALYAAQK
jgi:polyphosphate glucokinase